MIIYNILELDKMICNKNHLKNLLCIQYNLIQHFNHHLEQLRIIIYDNIQISTKIQI
jgi:hypothetical protein